MKKVSLRDRSFAISIQLCGNNVRDISDILMKLFKSIHDLHKTSGGSEIETFVSDVASSRTIGALVDTYRWNESPLTNQERFHRFIL